MSSWQSRLDGLPGLAMGLSLLACYGTLAVNLILGALGIAIALDEVLWAGVIVGFAAIAVIGLFVSYRRHHRLWPLAIGVVGFTAIIYAIYIEYHRLTELAGFALLAVAAFWDWQLRRSRSRKAT